MHLVGGGWTRAAADAVYGPFVAEAGGQIVLVVEAGEGSDEYAGRFLDVLAAVGARDVRVIAIDEQRVPVRADLDGAGGVVVGGGLTPNYHALLVERGGDWLPGDVPYLGFSAGAAIASRLALIGGWRVATVDGATRAVSPAETGEDLELVTTKPGLGLVPWTVDVHAGAWGTLARLVSVVASGVAPHGFAIDEDTSLVVRGDAWHVAGRGTVYELRRDTRGVLVCAHLQGAAV